MAQPHRAWERLGLGDDRANGEASTATTTDAKVDLGGSSKERDPIQPAGRSVESPWSRRSQWETITA